MILNVSGRTDIPAFYSDWFYNRIKAGFLLVRNPYYPTELIHIDLDPKTIDLIAFCTKNPRPMFKRLDELKDFRTYFMITITPYDRDLEPNVPKVKEIVKDILYLSEYYGKDHVAIRYDPIIVNQKYTINYHIHCFEALLKVLSNRVEECIISFVDLYQKSEIYEEVKLEDRILIAKEFAKIGKKYHIRIKTCAEMSYEKYGIEKSGCLSVQVVERLINTNIIEISHIPSRTHCNCIPSRDIGEYDTCLHQCRYCYATDHHAAFQNYLKHDPDSPLLIGEIQESDKIRKIKQTSLIDPQLSLFWGDL